MGPNPFPVIAAPFLPPPTVPSSAGDATQLLDVRGSAARSNIGTDLRESVRAGFAARSVPFVDSRRNHPTPQVLRSIPTMVLYDDRGLEIFDKITYIDEYYLTNAEIDIFQRYAQEIVRDHVQDGAVLVELGCGAMRKTKFILEAVAASGKIVTYCAVDLSEASLRASLAPLTAAFPSIQFIGLWGTYDDSLLWIKQSVPAIVPKLFLWLGSSIGNLTRPEAGVFLRSVCALAMAPGDLFVCGIDRRNNAASISAAYDDSLGLTREFILNGLDHINTIFSDQPPLFNRNNFEYLSIYNQIEGRHEAYYRVLRDHVVSAVEPAFAVELKQDELINVEYSYKYSAGEVAELMHVSQLYHVGKWTDSKDMYDLHLFQKPVATITNVALVSTTSAVVATQAPFSPKSLVRDANAGERKTPAAVGQSLVTPSLVPTLVEFEDIWKLWDIIWSSMIDSTNMLGKPISLRHPYIFYIGHLSGFADIQISRVMGTELTTPHSFADIFERGIDPDMEDPTKCHSHSTVPCTWPAISEIVDYTARVRDRVRKVYAAGTQPFSRHLARVLFMCYEHEAMHIETFLYMILQDPKMQPPHSVSRPILRSIHDAHTKPAEPATFVRIPSGKYVAGINCRESDDNDPSSAPPTVYGWDNESPAHDVTVDGFEIQDRPVTIGEYHAHLASRHWNQALVPASWNTVADTAATTSPHFTVKTAFGQIPIEFAWNWPVYVSNDQAKDYADAHGARLPTESELSFIRSSRRVNDKLDNNSFVSWTPRDVRSSASITSPATVFDTVTDIEGNGWELTSTAFSPYDGYEKSQLYPGYSSDFFNGKHNVVLGASWATPSRIATRKSFRNWYQRGYPYAFTKFRLVK